MNFHKKTAFLVLTIFFVLILAAKIFLLSNTGEADGILTIGKDTYPIEIASTEEEWVRGLSDRTEIGSTGLLFVFDSTGKHGIWMKDMNLQIDIIWLDEEFEIVHIEKNVSPRTFPKIFYPESDARYVFETDAGFSDELKINKGDKLNFSF